MTTKKSTRGNMVFGVGVELTCTFFVYGPKLHQKFVRDSLSQNSRHSL